MPENNTDIKKAIEWLRQVENAKQAMLQCECMFQDLRNTQNITSGYERGYEKVKDENGRETGEIKSFTRLKSAGSGGKNHDISDFIAVLEAEEQELERYKTDWLNKRIEVKKFLMSLNMNEKIKTILIFRYIGLYEWDEIAKKLGMSNTWVHNLKKQGLQIVARNLKKYFVKMY